MSIESNEINKVVVNTAIGLVVTLVVATLGGIWYAPFLTAATRTAAIGLVLLFIAFGVYYFLRLDGAGADDDSLARARYVAFRERFAAGGTPAKMYAAYLEWALDGVDRFFGDPGRADQSWLTRALGWDARGARWTAVAYDRCLVLALAYPVLSVIGFWAIYNKVGVAEQALGLQETPDFQRYLFAGGLVVMMSGIALSTLLSGWKGIVSLVGGIVGSAMVAYASAGAGAFAGAVAVAVAFAVPVAVFWLAIYSHERNRLGVFETLFSLTLLLACFAGAREASLLDAWPKILGPLLLFVGLFTVVNAPFDWLALGFTRALLRRGLAPHGWSPFFYAALDLVVAIGLMFALAFALVFAAQTFDDVAALRGGARILSLPKLFADLRADPHAPQVKWVWALMFSSMIPSFLNAGIAAMSLLRGLPRLHGRILRLLPAYGAIDNEDRFYVALALALHVALGAALTLLAFALLIDGLFPYVLPVAGDLLIGFGKFLAEANFPDQLIGRFTSHP